jgi:hypothetical protein
MATVTAAATPARDACPALIRPQDHAREGADRRS